MILDDIKIIREAFSLNAFTGRPDVKLFNFTAGGKHGKYIYDKGIFNM